MRIITFICCLLAASVGLSNKQALSSSVASDGGHIEIHTFYQLLSQFGVQVQDGVSQRHEDWSKNILRMPVKATGGLQLYAPYGALKAVQGGQLNLEGEFSWQLPQGSSITFKNLSVRPTTEPIKSGDLTILDLVNQDGQVVFFLNNIHAGFNQQQTQVFFTNMDLRISPWLAAKIQMPDLANHIAGQVNLYSNLLIPASYQAQPLPFGACSAGDNWPPDNPDVDVALIGMDEVEYLGDFDAQNVIFTPSATLESVGTADVAWYEKFDGTFPPYGNDQHPFLIWNMYREIDNRFEQIGVSGVKHAFFTVNTSCICPGGQVLFPTCQDKYSVGNNHLSNHLGPRQNISVFNGLWNSTGSFFDQNGDGVQDNSSSAIGENRMVVAEADFADDSLPYYVSSWYIVRDDVDIFNNMGHKQYQITANGSGWDLNSVSSFAQGSASDQYVTPNSFDLINGTASQRILQANEGHLTVAVKVIDNKDGSYRYNYMVENHDYDPQIQTISMPLAASASMTNFVFADTDSDSSNDWTAIRSNDVLTLQSTAGNEIDWGVLYSFSFTTDSPPQAGQVSLSGLENAGNQFDANLITPFFDDLIFANGFEILN